jgi:hypothetical protein
MAPPPTAAIDRIERLDIVMVVSIPQPVARPCVTAARHGFRDTGKLFLPSRSFVVVEITVGAVANQAVFIAFLPSTDPAAILRRRRSPFPMIPS